MPMETYIKLNILNINSLIPHTSCLIKDNIVQNTHVTYLLVSIGIVNVMGSIENKGNNKITELRTILQRESQNSQVYRQTKSVNNRKTVKTVMP
jgi:hypothetical protein